MASPGSKKYQDLRAKDLDHLYQRASAKRSFTLQKAVLRFRRPLLAFSRTRVLGAENIPKGECVLVSSHTSFFDPFWVGLAQERSPLRFVAKSQLFRFPLARLILLLGAFPVKRGTSDEQSFSVALKALQNNQRVLLFPQGGIHQNLHPDTARWGAGYLIQRATCPVVPVRVFYGKGQRTVVFGAARNYQDKSAPKREENIEAARDVLASIAAIKNPSSH